MGPSVGHAGKILDSAIKGLMTTPHTAAKLLYVFGVPGAWNAYFFFASFIPLICYTLFANGDLLHQCALENSLIAIAATLVWSI